MTGRDCYVYRIYSGDELLYIGSSRNVKRRIREHKAERPEMFSAATRYDMQGPYTEPTAREVEIVAIQQEQPRFNRRDNPAHIGSPAEQYGPINPKDVITAAAASKLLNVDRTTFLRWVAAGRIEPVMKLHGLTGARLFNRADVQALVNERAAS